jgi:hypothetical protein
MSGTQSSANTPGMDPFTSIVQSYGMVVADEWQVSG